MRRSGGNFVLKVTYQSRTKARFKRPISLGVLGHHAEWLRVYRCPVAFSLAIIYPVQKVFPKEIAGDRLLLVEGLPPHLSNLPLQSLPSLAPDSACSWSSLPAGLLGYSEP